MKKLILILNILILFYSCEKEPELTEITNDGKGGISCLVDGEILNSKGIGFGALSEYFGIGRDDNTSYFKIGFHNRNSKTHRYKIIEMQVYDVDFFDNQTFERISLEGNIYKLGEYGDINMYGQLKTYGSYWNDWDNNSNLEFYHTTEIIEGEIKIDFHDLENYIIAGTFWFNAINENGNLIEIREGRFDKIYGSL